jgi:hypothetical protein
MRHRHDTTVTCYDTIVTGHDGGAMALEHKGRRA